MSAADARTQGGPEDEPTLGQLFSSAGEDIQGLIRDEIELAKAEMRGTVKGVAVGGGSFGAAGILAIASVPMLSFAAAYGIHALGLALGWSFLIVGGAFLVLAAIFGLVGVSGFKKAKAPRKALAQNKKTLSTLGRAKPHPAPALSRAEQVRAVEDRTSRPALDH